MFIPLSKESPSGNVCGIFSFGAFFRVRECVLRLKEGQNAWTGDEEEVIRLPSKWPLAPPDGLRNAFKDSPQDVIDRAIAVGTFGLPLEIVVQIVSSTETITAAALQASAMQVLMGATKEGCK